MNNFKDVCRFLSKTDYILLHQGSSPNAKSTQTSLGFFVMLIGVIAGILGWMFFDLFMDNVFILTFAAFFCAALVMAFYRELVGSYSVLALFSGIPVALFFAYAAMVPIELKFFGGAIKTELNDAHMKASLSAIEKKYNSERSALNEKKNKLVRKIADQAKTSLGFLPCIVGGTGDPRQNALLK